MIDELLSERMLLDYLRISPSFGSVKLQKNGISTLNPNLVDTIFIAVQRQKTQITNKTDTLEAINHTVWRQGVIGMCHASSVLGRKFL